MPALIVAALAAGSLFARSKGQPQVDGTLKLAGLGAPVKVLRDEFGVPYIFAANTPDLIRAQGFVTAQSRLLQVDLFRDTWHGRPGDAGPLRPLHGRDAWKWGKTRAPRFVSPLRRSGAGQELLGGFTVKRPGSGETLNRGVYDFMKPYDVNFFASMRVANERRSWRLNPAKAEANAKSSLQLVP